jgi:hypothetical protein
MTGRSRKNPPPNARSLICDECGEDVAVLKPDERTLGIWRDARMVAHCKGQSKAFGAKYRGEPHHWPNQLHEPCPTCGANLGCWRCSGPWDKIACTNCRTFTNGEKPVAPEEVQAVLQDLIRTLERRGRILS